MSCCFFFEAKPRGRKRNLSQAIGARGAGNTVGTGVVDAFDLDAGSSARLANIATRGLVQPGDKLMIAGFIVQNGLVKMVARGIGPSLIDFGISNALPDTTLELHDQQGAIVIQNDDWQMGQPQELQNLGLQPSNKLEAAFVATEGDYDRFCELLSANPLKYGSLRDALERAGMGAKFDQLYETVIKRSVDGKPAKKVAAVEKRFIKQGAA